MSISTQFTIGVSELSDNTSNENTTVTTIRLRGNIAATITETSSTASSTTSTAATGTFVLDDGVEDDNNAVSFNFAPKVLDNSEKIITHEEKDGNEYRVNSDTSVSASVVLVNKNLRTAGGSGAHFSTSNLYCELCMIRSCRFSVVCFYRNFLKSTFNFFIS